MGPREARAPLIYRGGEALWLVGVRHIALIGELYC